MREQREIAVLIARPFALGAAYLAEPRNFPQWAAGLGSGLRRENDDWFVRTPQGEWRIAFSAPNGEGIADHVVYPPDAPPVVVPLRVHARGAHSEVVLTLIRQPDMSDADYARDAELARADLQKLRALLERD